MLEVQKYLKSGKSLEDLNNEYGIKVAVHPTDPLMILNYCQINSPKTATIVRECRALTLHSTTFDVVAKSMNRFFNWGEVQEEMDLFDFSDFMVQSKEDGSLVPLYYYDGQWRANTRGSFGLDNMQFQDFTWQEGFLKALGIGSFSELEGKLDPSVTYICEFCSPWNKIVRRYTDPQMFLLTAFIGLHELSSQCVDELATDAAAAFNRHLFKRPQQYSFCSIEEIQSFLAEQSANDPTYEGVVICDKNGLRYKVKNPAYLALHHLRGEGNVWNPKYLLPFIMTGEEAELLTYFPEAAETFYKLKAQIQQNQVEVLEHWLDYKDLPEQKDFALAIKNKTKFSGILFNVRKKYGPSATSKNIRDEWKDAEALILKNITI